MSRQRRINIQPVVEHHFGFNSDIFSEEGSSDEESVKDNKHSSSGNSSPEGSENGASYSNGSCDDNSRSSRHKNTRSNVQHGVKNVSGCKRRDGRDHSNKDGHSKSNNQRSHKVAEKGLRRSSRLQSETLFFDRQKTDLLGSRDHTKRKIMFSADVFSDEDSNPDSNNSNISGEEKGHKKSKTKTRKQNASKKVTSIKPAETKVRRVRHLSSSTEEEEELESESNSESGSDSEWTSSSVETGQNKSSRRNDKKRSASRRKVTQLKISYKEESDDGTDSDDLVELLEQENEDVGSSETVEKVMKSRKGKVGATGSKTTIYNVENDGDPNADLDLEKDEVEQQYLIKWKNWSHLHSTWESEMTLREMKVNGLQKLKNFKGREEQQHFWRLAASREEIEYQDCQDELTDELYLQYCEAERIVTEFPINTGAESFEYLIKWQGLPYSECTREDSRLIQKRFPDIVEQYKQRLKSEAIPNRHSRAPKVRPTFHRLQKQPDYIGGPKNLQLRDYQLKGLNWLLHSWCKGNGAILADEMGLGKTIQTISFFSVLMNVHQVYGPFLLIVPLSTVVTWQREFQVWAPQINVTVYIGDINTRNMIREYEWYERDDKKFNCNVVITTYEIVLKDKLQLSEITWAVLGVDEAHRLKNDDSMLYKSLIDFDTHHRLFITGTPLQNSLRELWSLLHFINPKRFEDWEEFMEKHSSADKTGFQNLHKELEPYLLRRVKKDVEKSLPAKVEQILHVEMSRSQRQCYRYILTRNYEALAKGMKGNISGFVNLMMELKKCCNHTALVRPLEDNEADEAFDMIVKGSGKLLLLDKLLPRLKESGHRVLIFSQMVRMLDIIADYMKLKGYFFQRLDGTISSERRKQAMDHFNAEGSQDFCFLLSTRAGGLGVNLVTADTVIIFDSDWNPQNDLQAMARAHRIGQKNQVSVYRLVTKNSVEEEIIERAKKKMVLDHLVIQRMDTSGRTVLDRTGFAGQSSRNPFSKEELNSILKFGAEELFKESDEEDGDTQVDVDDILKCAETRNTEDLKHSATDELLSNFKIVKFDNLEEEALEEHQPKHHITKGWDEIIPEAERQKIEEENRQLQLAEVQLLPRSRRNLKESDSDFEDGKMRTGKKRKKEYDDDDDDEEDETEDEDEEDDRQTKRRGKAREAVKGFTDAELRHFIRSLKKFAHPKKRVADVAEDAELQEKSEADLQHLADLILTNCDQTMKQFEEKQKEELQASPSAEGKKSRARPSFRLGTVMINARSILDAIQELEPLAKLMEPNSKGRICLGENVKKVHRFSCHWTVDDDVNLLKGVYTYGMGNWEAIKMDSELKLSDKILPDYDLKPQAKHLRSRTEYLLKILHEQMMERMKEKARIRKVSESGKRKGKGDADVDPHGKHLHSKKHKSHREKRDDQAHKKSKHEDPKGKARAPLHFTTKDTVAANITNSKLPKEDYEKCVEMMKPVSKSLLLLDEITSSGSTDKSQLVDVILLIGNQVNAVLTEYNNPTEIKEWRNNLWQYVTLFASPTYGIKRLKDLYRYAHDKQENEENRKLQEQTRQEESTLHYGNYPNLNRYDKNHWQRQKRPNTDSRSDTFHKRQRTDYTPKPSFRPPKVNSEDSAAQLSTDSPSRVSPSSSSQALPSSQSTSFRYRNDAVPSQQRNRDRCYPSPPSDAQPSPYYRRDVPLPGPLPPLPPLPPHSSIHFNRPLDAPHYSPPTWYGDNSSNSYSCPLPPPPHSQYGYNRDRKPFTSNQYSNEASSKRGQRRRSDSRFSGYYRQQPLEYQSYNRPDIMRSSYRDDRQFGRAAPSGSENPRVSPVEPTTTSPPKDFSQPHDIPVSSQFASVPSVSPGVAATLPMQSKTLSTSPTFPQGNY